MFSANAVFVRDKGTVSWYNEGAEFVPNWVEKWIKFHKFTPRTWRFAGEHKILHIPAKILYIRLWSREKK